MSAHRLNRSVALAVDVGASGLVAGTALPDDVIDSAAALPPGPWFIGLGDLPGGGHGQPRPVDDAER